MKGYIEVEFRKKGTFIIKRLARVTKSSGLFLIGLRSSWFRVQSY